MPLRFEDLDFSQLAFEVRFAPSYLLWDRAGRIWQETVRLFPTATVANAVPVKIVMRTGPIELTVEPNRAGLALFERDRLKDIPALMAGFANAVTSTLEIPEFTRIGLRIIHWRIFETKSAAAEAVMQLGFLKPPEGRHFGVSGLPLNPEIAFREEEGNKGFGVRIKAEGIEFKMEVPYAWQKFAKSVSETRQVLSVDIDSYLQGTILSSQVSFEDWIVQALHAIRRDADTFLGG